MNRQNKQSQQLTRFARVDGQDTPFAEVVTRAQRNHSPIVRVLASSAVVDDYAWIDPVLQQVTAKETPEPPADGLGFSGFTPAQRGAYLQWLNDPVEAAPPAFLNLYLANLEVRLLEGSQWPPLAHIELLRLSRATPWRQARPVSRTLLLSFWLAQDGAGLAAWLAEDTASPDVWPVALGMQAMLQTPLGAEQIRPLLRVWRIPGAPPALNTMAQRIASLATVLEAEPLQYALAYLDEPARAPKAWRTQHRDLKLELPQPDLRIALEPVLRELMSALAPAPLAPAPGEVVSQVEPTGSELAKAHMIVEFGHSRSDIFEYALRQAKKQPGFQQLMDENRHVIYRVPYRRNEMRHFWGLWDCVQTWTSTRVYCQGQELQKWQVYPYSQFIS